MLCRLKRERDSQEKAEAEAAKKQQHMTQEDSAHTMKPNDMIVRGVAPGKPIEGKKVIYQEMCLPYIQLKFSLSVHTFE